MHGLKPFQCNSLLLQREREKDSTICPSMYIPVWKEVEPPYLMMTATPGLETRLEESLALFCLSIRPTPKQAHVLQQHS